VAKSGLPEEVAIARAELAAKLVALVGDGEIPRLDEAFTHPSYSNESGAADNQRLELLGDTVLGLCVTEALLEDHPAAAEGELTRMRAALVNAEALARWGRQVRLGDCLAMGRGARAAVDKDQPNVLADAVEALIAAVYLGRGIEAARVLVREITGPVRAHGSALASLDPKSELQERVQAAGEQAPRYRVVGSSGPPHDPRFEVEVVVGETVVARGEGRSKRAAERAAAEAALKEPALTRDPHPPAPSPTGGEGVSDVSSASKSPPSPLVGEGGQGG
jgi:ribonuclease-3